MSTSATSSLQERLQAARQQMAQFDEIRKAAFQPAPAMPQQVQSPMDPAMQQQAMAQQGAPVDPAMMQGQPPMDPAMMQQGAPPMDPSMQPPSGGLPPEAIEEMMSLMEQMGQGLTQAMERIGQLEGVVQQVGPQLEELEGTVQSLVQALGQGQQPQPGQEGW